MRQRLPGQPVRGALAFAALVWWEVQALHGQPLLLHPPQGQPNLSPPTHSRSGLSFTGCGGPDRRCSTVLEERVGANDTLAPPLLRSPQQPSPHHWQDAAAVKVLQKTQEKGVAHLTGLRWLPGLSTGTRERCPQVAGRRRGEAPPGGTRGTGREAPPPPLPPPLQCYHPLNTCLSAAQKTFFSDRRFIFERNFTVCIVTASLFTVWWGVHGEAVCVYLYL